MDKTVIVLGNPSLGASDLSVLAGQISITGSSASINTKNLSYTKGLQRYLTPVANSYRLDFTTSNLTEYGFTARSFGASPFGPIEIPVYTTSDASATAAEIRAALVLAYNTAAAQVGLNTVATDPGSTNTYITITGGAATATLKEFLLFNVNGLTNMTIATGTSDAMYIAPNATAGTAMFGNPTVTITSAAAHGLIPGNLVLITGWAGKALTFNGVTASASTGIITRVATVPTTTTFTLDAVVGDATANSGTISILKVAQAAKGTPTQVQKDVDAYTNATPIYPSTRQVIDASYNYDSVEFTQRVYGTGGDIAVTEQNVVIYWPAALVASPFTATTSAGTFETNLASLLGGQNIGATTANPDLIQSASSNLYN
jgi:hypothetical protein